MKPQKEVQKEQPIQKENQLKTVCYSKPPVIEKQNRRKRKHEVFGKCITAAATTTNKTEKEYKISDVIKKEAS